MHYLFDHPTCIRRTSPQHLASYAYGVRASCSVRHPAGDGVDDPRFLLFGPQRGNYRHWFDTYEIKPDNAPDWYALTFPKPTKLNVVYWMHGPMFDDHGWWTSLEVEYRDAEGAWHKVEDLQITPNYHFSPQRGDRKPFSAYAAHFNPVRTSAIRLIGQPSGKPQITTMAYLAADWSTCEGIAAHLRHIQQPLPAIFDLLPANTLWDTLASLRDLTKIAFDLQTSAGLGLDHFLEPQHYQRFHESQRQCFADDSLYQLIGQHAGWRKLGQTIEQAREQAYETKQPVIAQHHGGLVWLVVPVISNDSVLGTIENRNFIAQEPIDWQWHRCYAQELGLDWERYHTALEQISTFSQQQINATINHVQQLVRLAQQLLKDSQEIHTLKSSALAAEVFSRSKSTFMSMMSHELRTPLNAIIGYSELLIDDLSATNQQQSTDDARQIRSAGRHLLHVIETILQVSNLESGASNVHYDDVDLEMLTNSLELSLRTQFQKRSNQLEIKIDPNASWVYSDSSKVRQIIFQLLNNANKFTDHGQVRLTIAPDSLDPEMLAFEVCDTGIGIDHEHLPLLFAEFSQLDASSTRRYDGTGMGLALCRHLARLLGGDIRVWSEPGIGSTFTLAIPRQSVMTPVNDL